MNRKPFQGIWNIIRFNRQFYITAIILIAVLLMSYSYWPKKLQIPLLVVVSVSTLTIIVSLAVSYYIYDYSDLYEMKWLPKNQRGHILNVHSGFDETSEIIKAKHPNSTLFICDFYDPNKHTEISIERARKAYPINPETIAIPTDKLPFEDNTFEIVIACLSAHEIRNADERIMFSKELHRVAKSDGQVFVTEHLRDSYNFLAYTIGFFHFHSRNTWLKTFEDSKFRVVEESKTTPFVTTFVLEKNGNSL